MMHKKGMELQKKRRQGRRKDRKKTNVLERKEEFSIRKNRKNIAKNVRKTQQKGRQIIGEEREEEYCRRRKHK